MDWRKNMSNTFLSLLKKKMIVFDGSTGTMLQKYGMPTGVSPEAFCLEKPEIIQRIQKEYLDAGSDIILTPTFGANRIKLKNFGLENKTVEINTQLAKLTLESAKKQNKFVAGDIGPTGIFFQPFGETAIEEGLDIFREQIRALSEAGVDCIMIETQIDIQETRLALMAAKEVTDLPVIASMTFDESQKTLTGSDPLVCLNILQSLGADGIGVNCSTGPDKMLPVIQQLCSAARIPVLVKPNAGLPMIQDGETVFPMQPEEFATYAEPFWELGVSMLGGCCGTTPEHIRQAAHAVQKKKPSPKAVSNEAVVLSSPRKNCELNRVPKAPIRVIGERINPTGKAGLQEELKAGKMEILKVFAREQKEKGADILDVNVGMPGIVEKDVMVQAIQELAVISDLPLCIDSSKPDVLEAALRFYPGRALVNSLSGETEKLKHIIPIIKKYGAAYIVLPLHDQGIPETLEQRIAVLDTIYKACEAQQVSKQDSVVDGLVMTVSSNQDHAKVTLDTLAYVTNTLKCNTVLGLSNISFGLPGRSYINSTFLAMAASAGLSSVIANPSVEVLMQAKYASDVLTGRDKNSKAYIEQFQRQGGSSAPRSTPKQNLSPEAMIQDIIVQGDKELIEKPITALLDQNVPAIEIVQKHMIPAIQLVGDKFNRKEYFLPQLIASAETMEKGVKILTPLLDQAEKTSKGVGVIATVKGDIHDIGKKIVALLLRNNGYDIIDLGKSVDEATIVNKAIEHKADFIGLSALMTTTMTEMKKVIDLVQTRQLNVKVILGGAVVTQKYADEIKADGFAVDAGKSVVLLEQLFSSVGNTEDK
jgi:5-methyltetrahydrofolate--homocysteine methyltransferase